MLYSYYMKRKNHSAKQVRISLKAWEQLRRVAFRSHKPMSLVLEDLVANMNKHGTKENVQ